MARGGLRIAAARTIALLISLSGAVVATGCSSSSLPPPPSEAQQVQPYKIGAGDSLEIFVWQNKDLSLTAPVRPDGQISLPLVSDIQAAGKTPTQLASDIQDRLKKFVTDPLVTIIVHNFVGPYSQQVRVVGEAQKPAAIAFREGMTALDVMITVGGLTQFASGNRATLIRTVDGQQMSYRLRLGDLLEDGEISANVSLLPGDVIIIPQTYF